MLASKKGDILDGKVLVSDDEAIDVQALPTDAKRLRTHAVKHGWQVELYKRCFITPTGEYREHIYMLFSGDAKVAKPCSEDHAHRDSWRPKRSVPVHYHDPEPLGFYKTLCMWRRVEDGDWKVGGWPMHVEGVLRGYVDVSALRKKLTRMAPVPQAKPVRAVRTELCPACEQRVAVARAAWSEHNATDWNGRPLNRPCRASKKRLTDYEPLVEQDA